MCSFTSFTGAVVSKRELWWDGSDVFSAVLGCCLDCHSTIRFSIRFGWWLCAVKVSRYGTFTGRWRHAYACIRNAGLRVTAPPHHISFKAQQEQLRLAVIDNTFWCCLFHLCQVCHSLGVWCLRAWSIATSPTWEVSKSHLKTSTKKQTP